MKTEYEATFPNIAKDAVREKLRAAGAAMERPEFLMKRAVFDLPTGHEIPGAWARVRDEGDKVTMSIKVLDGSSIADQKESYLVVSDFEEGISFLKTLGCREKSRQESRRELWRLAGVEITIDEWPFLEPFLEVEGDSEQAVKAAVAKLGFDWAQAKFCAVGKLYSEKYGLPEEVFNDETPLIAFGMENPFAVRSGD